MLDRREVGVFCGLEMSAKELVVAVEDRPAVQRFANTEAGHRLLVKTLTRGGGSA
jgi:hypothetical protein